MIAGIGLDIARVSRMAAVLKKHPQRLPRRLLTPEERAEFEQRGQSPQYLAGRFAAKEALAKALGTGLRAPMLLSAAAVVNNPDGQPQFQLRRDLARRLKEKGVQQCHLSISHEGDFAAAMVVAEKA